MGVVLAPLAIVWGCPLSVSEYEAAGKLVEVPELTCPGCGVRLRPWPGSVQAIEAPILTYHC